VQSRNTVEIGSQLPRYCEVERTDSAVKDGAVVEPNEEAVAQLNDLILSAALLSKQYGHVNYVQYR
jgi:hypothetical protein